jgi:hypothetical protein
MRPGKYKSSSLTAEYIIKKQKKNSAKFQGAKMAP